MVWEIIHQQLLWDMHYSSNTVITLGWLTFILITFVMPYLKRQQAHKFSSLGYEVAVIFFLILETVTLFEIS